MPRLQWSVFKLDPIIYRAVLFAFLAAVVVVSGRQWAADLQYELLTNLLAEKAELGVNLHKTGLIKAVSEADVPMQSALVSDLLTNSRTHIAVKLMDAQGRTLHEDALAGFAQGAQLRPGTSPSSCAVTATPCAWCSRCRRPMPPGRP